MNSSFLHKSMEAQLEDKIRLYYLLVEVDIKRLVLSLLVLKVQTSYHRKIACRYLKLINT